MRMTIGNVGNDGVLVAVSGNIDALTADTLFEKLQKNLKDGRHRLALDFTDVLFISSAGLGVLLKTQQEATKLGGSLRLFGLTENVRRVFKIVGFDRIIPIVGNRDEALDGWQDMEP